MPSGSFRIDTDSNDPYHVAAEIAAFAKDGGYELILTGKESIDYNNGVVGGALAELLDANYIGFATKLEVSGGTATVSREIEGVVDAIANFLRQMTSSFSRIMASGTS